MLIIATSFLFYFMRVVRCDLTLGLTFRGSDLGYLNPYDQFPLFELQVTLYSTQ
jgi:hypothetical protein